MGKDPNKIIDLLNSIRGVSILGGSDIIAGGITAVFWLYVATLMEVEDYGEISYIIAIGSVATTVSLIGSTNTLPVYIAKNVPIQSTIYFFSILIAIVSSIVSLLIFFSLELPIFILGLIVSGLAMSEIIGKKLYGVYAKYIITQKVLMVVLAIGLFHTIGPDGIILGIAISCFIYCKIIFKAFQDVKIDFNLIRERIKFILSSYSITLAGVASISIGKLIVAPLLGFVILGNYHLALQFISAFFLFPQIIYRYTLPHDASGVSNTKLKIISVLFTVGFTVIIIFTAPIVIPIFFPKYLEVVSIVQILSLSLIPTMIGTLYASKYMGNEKANLVVFSLVLNIVSQIIGMLYLGNIYGVRGIAIAYVISSVISIIPFSFIEIRDRIYRIK